MRRTVRLLAIFLVLFGCAGCDQAAKSVARDMLAARPPVVLFGGIVHLRYAENPGAFLGLGAEWPAPVRSVLLVAAVAAILAGLVVYVLRAGHLSPTQLAGLSLLAGGGISNLIDRLFRDGRVVDFVRLSLGPLHTGVFNLADVAIMGGGLLFALGTWRMVRAAEPARPDDP